MDKILYKLLLPLVNDKSCYNILQEYAEARVANLLQQLSTERNMDNVVRIQGAITELRRFSTLREETVEGAK